MPRPLRHDWSGAMHHVMNRGVGHRPIFETRADVRYFLARVARVVRSGLVEVHAYSILTTHFHLLLTSRSGRLDAAMRLVQDGYARRFNRTRERDGGLFRDRYRSKLVRDTFYRDAVIWYIDRNAVAAGMVARAEDYPYCSAHVIARREKGPRWLSRGHAEALGRVRALRDAARDVAGTTSSALWGLLDRWIEASASAPGDLQSLVSGSPEYVRRWLRSNAKTADGGPTGTLVVHAETIRASIRDVRVALAGRHGPSIPESEVRAIETGLLYFSAALPVRAIATQVSKAESTVVARLHRYRALMTKDAAAARFASEALRRAIEAEYAPLRPV